MTDRNEDKALAQVQAPTSAPIPANPFRKEQAGHLSAGTVAIESERATAEIQGRMVIARRFPRDPAAAWDQAMKACQSVAFARTATYSYPRGAETVSGPSIRLAEELARVWGHMDYGLRELSQRNGESEMEAYAWDLQSNTSSRQQFTVRHIRDKRGGAVELTDTRDVYEITANMGARRMRARILAIIPDALVEAAVAQCRKTIAQGEGEKLSDRVKRMVAAFKPFGVTAKHIAQRLGHELDAITVDELADLQGMFNALKDGHKPSEFFDVQVAAPPAEEKKGSKGKKPDEPAATSSTAPAASSSTAPAASSSTAGTTPPATTQPADVTTFDKPTTPEVTPPAAKGNGPKGDLF